MFFQERKYCQKTNMKMFSKKKKKENVPFDEPVFFCFYFNKKNCFLFGTICLLIQANISERVFFISLLVSVDERKISFFVFFSSERHLMMLLTTEWKSTRILLVSKHWNHGARRIRLFANIGRIFFSLLFSNCKL